MIPREQKTVYLTVFDSSIVDTDEIYYDEMQKGDGELFRGWAKQKPEWIEEKRPYRVEGIKEEIPGTHIFESPLDALEFQKKELQEALRKVKEERANFNPQYSKFFIKGE